jgi:hypothetical protein
VCACDACDLCHVSLATTPHHQSDALKFNVTDIVSPVPLLSFHILRDGMLPSLRLDLVSSRFFFSFSFFIRRLGPHLGNFDAMRFCHGGPLGRLQYDAHTIVEVPLLSQHNAMRFCHGGPLGRLQYDAHTTVKVPLLSQHDALFWTQD